MTWIASLSHSATSFTSTSGKLAFKRKMCHCSRCSSFTWLNGLQPLLPRRFLFPGPHGTRIRSLSKGSGGTRNFLKLAMVNLRAISA